MCPVSNVRGVMRHAPPGAKATSAEWPQHVWWDTARVGGSRSRWWFFTKHRNMSTMSAFLLHPSGSPCAISPLVTTPHISFSVTSLLNSTNIPLNNYQIGSTWYIHLMNLNVKHSLVACQMPRNPSLPCNFRKFQEVETFGTRATR